MLRIVAVGYAALLITLGVQPSHPEAASVGFLTTVLHLTADQAEGFRAMVDLAGNVAVFVPLGLLVAAAWRSPAVGLLAGLGVSATCELVQLFEPGRVASLVDVLTNATGAALGAALLARRAPHEDPRPAAPTLSLVTERS